MHKQFYKNHHIRKRFGQHFLINVNIINRIISAINPQSNDYIIEIGPGLGALTEPIIKYLDNLTIIEIDRDLVRRLSDNNHINKKIIILEKDVMNVNFSKLIQKNKKMRIFGNLPYNISTKIIFYLFNYITFIKDMHFMLQKEVADRLVAKPGEKSYGKLTIMAQYYCQIIPLFTISSGSFFPSPNVDSVMVRLIPHQIIPYPAIDMCMLNFIVNEAFKKRRKILRNSLKNIFTAEVLELFGICPLSRAENISGEQYIKLANSISNQYSLVKKNIFPISIGH
ncbi:16S rRNA (adenine(1518)-N(6)/adenine(1519)-N(6))-dimethyltransferase RsmA [Candidatus Ishikawella capsulata]|nr:16S rRNA (adenine(1518)-N(6)/adenine(1519)-N(6))-dimethyltransferase RsmA [Candidatus Ishikawaella capsulata]